MPKPRLVRLAESFRQYPILMITLTGPLTDRLIHEPGLIHRLTPAQFEEFVCDRLFAMGFEPRQRRANRIGWVGSSISMLPTTARSRT